ncbi:anti-sigma factor RsbA family regulatory protein [Nocardiopsis mangrovi]|uniref:Anti-sigma factor RsbA family regulatory protein n=1 Tax=Nocardiopsis mangrovi TaxID=1179818 RepID=A0ABV9DWM0_9ACTN
MTSRAGSAPTGTAGFDHQAVLVGAPEDLRDVVAPRIRAAADGGGRVLVAVALAARTVLRDALGDLHPSTVRFMERDELYDAPGRTLVSLQRLAQSLAPDGGPLTVVGEPPMPLRDPLRLREWQRMESVMATCLAGSALRLICLHDARAAPPAIRAGVRRTHPVLLDRGGRRPSPDHVSPAAFSARDTGRRLPAPVGDLDSVDIHPDLPALREEIRGLAAASGMPGDRAGDLVVAANELAANALEHGAGKGTVSVWRRPGWVVCDVIDENGGLTDPLSGYLSATPPGPRGYGLWITRQICDFMEISGGDHGSLVRLHFRVPQ